MNEEWRTLAEHPGYEASSAGRIRRRFKSDPDRYCYLKSWTSRWCPYAKVGLRNRRRYFVHELVLEAFVGKRPPGLVANHKNGVKQDNSATNLEWITQGQNNRHAIATGLRRVHVGEETGKAKLTNHEILAAYQLAGLSEWPLEDIAAVFGVCGEVVRQHNLGMSAYLATLGVKRAPKGGQRYHHVKIARKDRRTRTHRECRKLDGSVTADWSQKDKPAKWAVSLERPAESATEARRLRLEA